MSEPNVEPDLYWDESDPERLAADSLHDLVEQSVDWASTADFPVMITVQCAKRLPDMKVRIIGVVGDELQYEIVED